MHGVSDEAACLGGTAPRPGTFGGIRRLSLRVLLLGSGLALAFAASTDATPASLAARAAAAGSFATVNVRVPRQNRRPPFNEPRRLRVPAGWQAEVWARVAGARFALWTPARTLLVSVPAAGEIIELSPGATAAAVPHQRVLVSGLTDPQGMAFDTLEGRRVLYVAESDEIDRYLWRSDGTLGARQVIVAELPDAAPGGDGVASLKAIVVAPDHSFYVDVGSSSNLDTTDLTAKRPRAVVMVYQPDGKGHVFASGIRNGDGLSLDPAGALWTAVNERDQIAYPFRRPYGGYADAYGKVITAYVNNHPPDELAKLTPGRDLGWPYCNPDPDVTLGAESTALRYGNLRFDDDEQTNPGGSRLDCAKLAPLQRGLPAHSAPLGFHFLEGSALPAPWSKGAVLATHGSSGRTPPRAPAVLWLPWERSGATLGAPVELVSGFQAPDGTRWGRPVDAVPGPDGALYVTDDTAGAVYRLVPSR